MDFYLFIVTRGIGLCSQDINLLSPAIRNSFIVHCSRCILTSRNFVEIPHLDPAPELELQLFSYYMQFVTMILVYAVWFRLSSDNKHRNIGRLIVCEVLTFDSCSFYKSQAVVFVNGTHVRNGFLSSFLFSFLPWLKSFKLDVVTLGIPPQLDFK